MKLLTGLSILVFTNNYKSNGIEAEFNNQEHDQEFNKYDININDELIQKGEDQNDFNSQFS